MNLSPFWRLIALLTLLLYTVLAFLIVRLTIRNIVFALVFGLTILCLAGGLLTLFSRTNSRARVIKWLVGVFSLVLVIEIVYFIRSAEFLRILTGFVLLTMLYLGFVSLLRKKYWSNKKVLAEQSIMGVHFKKPYLLVNPKSGNGRAIKAHVDTLAAKQGIKVLVLKKGDDIESIARTAVAAGADVLGISGGDGSIGAVVKVAIEQKIPIVVLPGGTRCHFARDLGLAPERIADALRGFHGMERSIDVGVINGRYFLNNTSLGLYADIIDSPDYRDHKVAITRNVLHQLTTGQKDLYDLHFKYGRERFTKALQILIGVNSYKTVNILELGHRDKLDEGILQITAITKTNNKTVRQLLMNLHKEKMRGMYQWRATEFKVTNKKKKIIVGVDGEREEYKTPVTIRILPKAVRVIVPIEGVRNRPKSPFSFFIMNQAWRIFSR